MSKKFSITCLVNDHVNMEGGFWGEHGLSMLIESHEVCLLFDTGTSADILSHNLRVLKRDLKDVTHIVLSHGHYDHTGGLQWVLSQVSSPQIIADPATFDKKFSREEKKAAVSTGSPLSREQVEKSGNLHVTVEPYRIAPNITVTGWIPRLTTYETTPSTFYIEAEGKLEHDQVLDDRSIVLETERGLVLVCGCCHAGLINTLMHIKESFNRPILAVVGGIHLIGASANRISKTQSALRDEFSPESLHLNHCTGDEAYTSMKCLMGTRVKPFLAGDRLEF
jgi:7,8-dihydropterin-6-yl-methyl-4-(beta-D-ribofuranosyl)aminobenzene 5'-phosphate synthase